MRNFKLIIARIVGALAIAFGYYLYHTHHYSNKHEHTMAPCRPGYVEAVVNGAASATCVKEA